MPPETISDAPPEEVFLQQLPVIEKVISSICRRHCCFGADAEDFGSTVKLKIMDDDYAVLRKFRGRSGLATYLTAVVANQFRDFRIRRWGKWRPSASARDIGTVAVQLEELKVRDGRSFDEAVEILRNRLGEDAPSRQELHDVAVRLPARTPRRFEGDEGLESLPDADQADHRVVDEERAALAKRAREALRDALGRLPAEDRLMVRMRFEDRFTAGRIAKQLGLKQRRVYTRLEQLMKTLRRDLEDAGIRDTDIPEILGWGEDA